MKKLKNLKKCLLGGVALVLAMSMLTMTVFAAPDSDTPEGAADGASINWDAQASLTIHKKIAPKYSDGKPGTGEEVSNLPDSYDPVLQGPSTGSKGINGVTFSIYKIADAAALKTYYAGDATGNFEVATYVEGNRIKEEYKDTWVKDIVTAGEGDNAGTATTALELGIYLVIETNSPDAVKTPAAPFLVSIPMTKADGTGWLYHVHVYPKNELDAWLNQIIIVKWGETAGVADSKSVLEGVKFILEKEQADGTWMEITKKSEQGADNAGEPLNLTTDQYGRIQIYGLSVGKYRFREAELPENSGYILNDIQTYGFEIFRDENKKLGIRYDNAVVSTRSAYYSYNLSPDESLTQGYVWYGLGSGATTDPELPYISVVNEKPTFDKKIPGKDPRGAAGETYSVGTSGSYSVGDLIDYELTVSVPKSIANLKTFYVVDTPTNLDDKIGDGSGFKVAAGTSELSAPTYYEVTREGEHGFKVTFKPAMDAYAGQMVTISYKAELLEGALQRVDNGNDAKVVYSSSTTSDGEPGDGKTTEIETTEYAYSYQLKLIKKAESADGDPLPGVEFDLYKEAAAGTEGAITGSDAGALGLATDKNYLKINDASLKTGADGTITQGGLANGTYYLVETKTVKDYNLLSKPVEVNLEIQAQEKRTTTTTTAEDGTVTTKTTVTVTHSGGQTDNAQGICDQTIINRKGFTLPSTGGMGTFVFTFVGVAMMAAAVILFITSKKKEVK